MKSNRSRVAVRGRFALRPGLAAGDDRAGGRRARPGDAGALDLLRGLLADPHQLRRADRQPRLLLEGAYDGMSDALDPFSYYVPASAMAAYKAQQASGAASAGIVFARRGGYPYVVAPLPGSPAEKAGVKAGDLIDIVDGKPLRNAPLWKIKAALEGPEGFLVRDRTLPRRRREAADHRGPARPVRAAGALDDLGARRRHRQDPVVHARDGGRSPQGAGRGRRAARSERSSSICADRSAATRPMPRRWPSLFVGEGPDRDGGVAQGRRQGPRRHRRAGLEGPHGDPDGRFDGRAGRGVRRGAPRPRQGRPPSVRRRSAWRSCSGACRPGRAEAST